MCMCVYLPLSLARPPARSLARSLAGSLSLSLPLSLSLSLSLPLSLSLSLSLPLSLSLSLPLSLSLSLSLFLFFFTHACLCDCMIWLYDSCVNTSRRFPRLHSTRDSTPTWSATAATRFQRSSRAGHRLFCVTFASLNCPWTAGDMRCTLCRWLHAKWLMMHMAHVVTCAFGRKLGAASQNAYSTEIQALSVRRATSLYILHSNTLTWDGNGKSSMPTPRRYFEIETWWVCRRIFWGQISPHLCFGSPLQWHLQADKVERSADWNGRGCPEMFMGEMITNHPILGCHACPFSDKSTSFRGSRLIQTQTQLQKSQF